MDHVDALLEDIRLLFAGLDKLRLMDGPEMLLPGRIEQYHKVAEGAREVYTRAEKQLKELGLQLDQELQRLDKGVVRYGPKQNDLQ